MTFRTVIGREAGITLLVMLILYAFFRFTTLGLAGCAWSTLLVNWTMLGVALWMLRTQDLYQPYDLWRALEPVA